MDFFSSRSGLNLTICVCVLPLGVYYGAYPGVTHPWLDLSCAYPVIYLLFGLYIRQFSRLKPFWSVSYGTIYWCPLLLADIGVVSDSTSVPKPRLPSSTNIDSTWLLMCWLVLDPCWDIFELMSLDYDIRSFSRWLTYCIQDLYILSH